MATDWNSFAKEIREGVLNELGSSRFYVEVPVGVPSRSSTGKKTETRYETYGGSAVMGKYDSEFPSTGSTVIQAGDVKLVAQFDDKTFEPSDKKNEVAVLGGKRYTIVNVQKVAPDGKTHVVFVIQGRRIN